MLFSRNALALFLGLMLLAFAGCDTKETSGPGGRGYPPPTERFPENALYVANQSSATVSVISTETNEVVATLDLTDYGFTGSSGTAPGAKPHDVVVEPDGSAFYVSLISDNVVAKFNRAGELVGTVPFESPGMIALAPGGDLLYVTHTMSIVNVPSTVAAIQRSDMTLVNSGEPVEVGIDRPHGVGVHPGGEYAYTGSLAENRLATIATETQAIVRRPQQPAPRQRYVHFALSSGGNRLYATGQDAGQVRVFNVSDPAAPQLRNTVDVGPEPFHPALSEDGRTLYVPNKGDHTVTALDTQTLETQTISGEGLAQPHGSTLSPDGDWVYISNNNLNGTYGPAGENGTVVVISTATHEIEKVIEVGRNPRGIGVRERG